MYNCDSGRCITIVMRGALSSMAKPPSGFFCCFPSHMAVHWRLLLNGKLLVMAISLLCPYMFCCCQHDLFHEQHEHVPGNSAFVRAAVRANKINTMIARSSVLPWSTTDERAVGPRGRDGEISRGLESVGLDRESSWRWRHATAGDHGGRHRRPERSET
jgi:hypothetical protein